MSAGQSYADWAAKRDEAHEHIAGVRAVRIFRRGEIRPVHVSPGISEQLGWPACACGAGGIRPGAAVTWRGQQWHVECALAAIRRESSIAAVFAAVAA